MDRDGRTPLHQAAYADDASKVSDLLAAGELPDAKDRQGFTPLHLSAQEYAVAAASALLDGGASPDAENMFGSTPLFVAVFNSRGRGDMIELLRHRVADPFHTNKSGQTPVGLARLIASYDVAQYFEDVAD